MGPRSVNFADVAGDRSVVSGHGWVERLGDGPVVPAGHALGVHAEDGMVAGEEDLDFGGAGVGLFVGDPEAQGDLGSLGCAGRVDGDVGEGGAGSGDDDDGGAAGRGEQFGDHG